MASVTSKDDILTSIQLDAAPDADIGEFEERDSSTQVLQIQLARDTVRDMQKVARSGKNIHLGFGKHLYLKYGNISKPLHAGPSLLRQELYTADPQDNKWTYTGLVSHNLAVDSKDSTSADGKEISSAALAKMREQYAAIEQQKMSNQTIIRNDPLDQRNKRSRTNAVSALRANRIPQAAHPHQPSGAPAGLTPSISSAVDQAQRFALLHLLAIRPANKLSLHQQTSIPCDILDSLLDKIAEKSESSGEWSLSTRRFKELDVWRFPYPSSEDRQLAVDNAVRAFDKLRLSTSDKLWQLLLPRTERGKGRILSKLNSIPTDHRKLLGVLEPHSSPRPRSPSSPSRNAASDNEDMKRSGSSAGARPRAVSKTDSSVNDKAAKPQKRKAADVKSESKFKSDEFVHESDDDSISPENPSQGSSSIQLGLKRKADVEERSTESKVVAPQGRDTSKDKDEVSRGANKRLKDHQGRVKLVPGTKSSPAVAASSPPTTQRLPASTHASPSASATIASSTKPISSPAQKPTKSQNRAVSDYAKSHENGAHLKSPSQKPTPVGSKRGPAIAATQSGKAESTASKVPSKPSQAKPSSFLDSFKAASSRDSGASPRAGITKVKKRPAQQAPSTNSDSSQATTDKRRKIGSETSSSPLSTPPTTTSSSNNTPRHVPKFGSSSAKSYALEASDEKRTSKADGHHPKKSQPVSQNEKRGKISKEAVVENVKYDTDKAFGRYVDARMTLDKLRESKKFGDEITEAQARVERLYAKWQYLTGELKKSTGEIFHISAMDAKLLPAGLETFTRAKYNELIVERKDLLRLAEDHKKSSAANTGTSSSQNLQEVEQRLRELQALNGLAKKGVAETSGTEEQDQPADEPDEPLSRRQTLDQYKRYFQNFESYIKWSDELRKQPSYPDVTAEAAQTNQEKHLRLQQMQRDILGGFGEMLRQANKSPTGRVTKGADEVIMSPANAELLAWKVKAKTAEWNERLGKMKTSFGGLDPEGMSRLWDDLLDIVDWQKQVLRACALKFGERDEGSLEEVDVDGEIEDTKARGTYRWDGEDD